MTQFLIRRFIKDYEQTKQPTVRKQYGTLAAVTGMVCNIILFIVKMTTGIVMRSISITADAINNLSDMCASLVSFIGFKMAAKPADEEHPFGHGRAEYITAFIVSFIIMLLGYEFVKTSLVRIAAPQMVEADLLSLVLLLLAIGVKMWMMVFNKTVGERIGSALLLATAADSRNDCLITGVTVVSIFVTYFTGIIIDGYAGVIVGAMILYNGFTIARDTLSSLLGESTDPALASEIKGMLEQYNGIIGSHDLIVHNYGPNNSIASIHAEVPNHVKIEVSHEIIDRAEREIGEALNIILVIHMDPINLEDERIVDIQHKTQEALGSYDERLNAHDFRIVDGDSYVNIIFDLIVPHGFKPERQKQLLRLLQKEIKTLNEKYNVVVNVENEYVRWE